MRHPWLSGKQEAASAEALTNRSSHSKLSSFESSRNQAAPRIRDPSELSLAVQSSSGSRLPDPLSRRLDLPSPPRNMIKAPLQSRRRTVDTCSSERNDDVEHLSRLRRSLSEWNDNFYEGGCSRHTPLIRSLHLSPRSPSTSSWSPRKSPKAELDGCVSSSPSGFAGGLSDAVEDESHSAYLRQVRARTQDMLKMARSLSDECAQLRVEEESRPKRAVHEQITSECSRHTEVSPQKDMPTKTASDTRAFWDRPADSACDPGPMSQLSDMRMRAQELLRRFTLASAEAASGCCGSIERMPEAAAESPAHVVSPKAWTPGSPKVWTPRSESTSPPPPSGLSPRSELEMHRRNTERLLGRLQRASAQEDQRLAEKMLSQTVT